MQSVSIENHLDINLGAEKRELDNLLKRLSSKQKKLKNSYTEGDVNGIIECLSSLLEENTGSSSLFERLKNAVGEFNLSEYLDESFDVLFRSALEEENISIRGEYPVYEIFPFIVKISSKEGFAIINKKKVRGLRIRYLVSLIKKERERFLKSSFRADEFLKDVAQGYDIVIATKKAKQIGVTDGTATEEVPVPIMDVYRALTPMKRHRREYTTQLFGFDIYRLLQEEASNQNATVLNGDQVSRRCIFGSTRIGSRNGITVVEESGRETTFGSIKFIKLEAQIDDNNAPVA